MKNSETSSISRLEGTLTRSPASSLEKKAKRLFWKLLVSKLSRGERGTAGKVGSVLVIRPDRLGDFILSVPALQALEKSLGSQARFTLVAGVRNGALARFFFPRAVILVSPRNFLRRLALFVRLWRGKYDAVVDLHSYPFSTSSALMTLLAGSPRRAGFWASGDFREYGEVSRKIFNLGTGAPPENLHESQKGMRLVRCIAPVPKARPVLHVPPVPPEIRQGVAAFFRSVGAGPRDRLVGIHPTLGKKDNRWSPGKYLELVRELLRVRGLKIVVIHGMGEGPALERFKEGLPDFSNVFILPETDVLFILEAAKRFDLFVCNDSGLMHLAALVTKVLAVFGPSEPARWGPLPRGNVSHRVLRKKDGLCDSVSALEVAREIKKLKR